MKLIDPNEEIAPGVRGYTVDLGDKGLYVPLVIASHPGTGEVGRYLDSLPADRRVVFPCVLSARLEGMLERRGFHVEVEYDDFNGEDVECWVRP